LLRTAALKRAERACREEAAELMRFVGLGAWLDARADAMPYGGLKRLEIARALATQPRLLLLDEPAAGLNPAETLEVVGLIGKLSERGHTVVLVEHNMRLVMGVSDHVLVLDYGRKLAEGSCEQVRGDARVIEAYLGAAEAGEPASALH
jgi:branched-chain amino acid transport system ATP-binding protein